MGSNIRTVNVQNCGFADDKGFLYPVGQSQSGPFSQPKDVRVKSEERDEKGNSSAE